MSGFIAKPFRIEDALKTLLDLAREPISKAHLTCTTTNQQTNNSPQSKDLLIDQNSALEFWASSAKLKRVLLEFSVENQTTALNITKLTANEASAALHKLKGSAATLGLTSLVVEISRLQRLLNDAADPNQVKVQMAQLELTFADTLKAIQRFCSHELSEPKGVDKASDLDA